MPMLQNFLPAPILMPRETFEVLRRIFTAQMDVSPAFSHREVSYAADIKPLPYPKQ